MIFVSLAISQNGQGCAPSQSRCSLVLGVAGEECDREMMYAGVRVTGQSWCHLATPAGRLVQLSN